MSKHTPGPWEVNFHVGSSRWLIEWRGERVCVVDGSSHAKRDADNAQRIVRCVNLHDELLAALKKLRDVCHEVIYVEGVSSVAFDEATREAGVVIAKAEHER